MPKFIDHTGEKRMMNCGLEATISTSNLRTVR